MLFAGILLVVWMIAIVLLSLGNSPIQRQQDRTYITCIVCALCLMIAFVWAVSAMIGGQTPSDDSILWTGVVGIIVLPFAVASSRTLGKMRTHDNQHCSF